MPEIEENKINQGCSENNEISLNSKGLNWVNYSQTTFITIQNNFNDSKWNSIINGQ